MSTDEAVETAFAAGLVKHKYCTCCEHAAPTISTLRQEVKGLEDQQWEFTSLLSDGANREKALRQEVETLREAMKPFADAVYNDNGDVTVSYHGIDIGHWLRAYRLQRLPKDKP